MRTPTRVLLGLAAAGVVASGSSAFTASSSITEPGARLGYGAHTVTGVTVNNIEYVSGSSIEEIAQVAYTVSGDALDVTTDRAWLALNDPTDTPVDDDCDITSAGALITCDLPSGTKANDVDGVYLVVKPR